MSPFLGEQRREAPQNAGPSDRLPFLRSFLGKQKGTNKNHGFYLCSYSLSTNILQPTIVVLQNERRFTEYLHIKNEQRKGQLNLNGSQLNK